MTMAGCKQTMMQMFRQTRMFSTARTSLFVSKKSKLKMEPPPPPQTTRDWIGPADPDSNMRPVRPYVPADETHREKRYRQLRLEVQEWNQEFWAKHNRAFFEQKEEFIKNKLGDEPTDSKKKLTPEELSVFYKRFLDENSQTHADYNREWYKKNVYLLWTALRVKTDRVLGLR